jgi:hypothetical protein
MPAESKPTDEVVMAVLHASGKFGGKGYKVSGRRHGGGVSAVNALADWLELEIGRDGKVYSSRGVPLDDLRQTGTTQSASATAPRPRPIPIPSGDAATHVAKLECGNRRRLGDGWSWYPRSTRPLASGDRAYRHTGTHARPGRSRAEIARTGTRERAGAQEPPTPQGWPELVPRATQPLVSLDASHS